MSEFDSAAVRSLDNKGLVRGVYTEGGGMEAASLTNYCKAYLADNPKLRNPIDWKWIVTIILLALTAIATVATFFVACSLRLG